MVIFKGLIQKIYERMVGIDIITLEGVLNNVKQQRVENVKHIEDIKATMDGEDTWFIEIKREGKHGEGDDH